MLWGNVMSNHEFTEEEYQVVCAYRETICAAKESAHEKAVACMLRGKALVGVRESSPLSGIKKAGLVLAVAAAAGLGGKYYLENHGLTFGETAPTGAVNLAEGYAPPPDTVISDHDKAAAVPAPKPPLPVPATQKKECSPKLTGAALAWCQKQKHIAPLSPQKNTESVNDVIRRHNHG